MSLSRHHLCVLIGYICAISLVFTSTELAFLTTSEKHKSASPSAIQIKNWQKTISIEKELSVIMRHEEGERIVDICHVTLAHGITHKIRDTADRIKESTQSGTEVFVQQDYHSPICTKNCDCESLKFILH
jgi:hypothetical protein